MSRLNYPSARIELSAPPIVSRQWFGSARNSIAWADKTTETIGICFSTGIKIYSERVRQTEFPSRAITDASGHGRHRCGDSFNDTAMLIEPNVRFLIHAPEKVKKEFPQFKAVESHAELMKLIKQALA